MIPSSPQATTTPGTNADATEAPHAAPLGADPVGAAIATVVLEARLNRSGPVDPVTRDAVSSLAQLPGFEELLQQAALQWHPCPGTEPADHRRQFADWLIARLPNLPVPEREQTGYVLGVLLGENCVLTPRAEFDVTQRPQSYWLGGYHVAFTPKEPEVPPEPEPTGPDWEALGLFTPERIEQFRTATDAATQRTVLLTMADDLCTAAQKTAKGEFERLNNALLVLRSVAAELGATLPPITWTFHKDIDAVPFEQSGDVEVGYMFDQTVTAGQVIRLKRLGWSSEQDTDNRTGQVIISAGLPNDAVRQCIAILAQIGDDRVAPLKDRVRDWLCHLRFGTFDDELKDFYVAMHDATYLPWRDDDESSFDRLQESVINLLTERRGYRAFFPTRRDDYQVNWIISVGNTASRTGRVNRVVRPGLMDAEQRLIVPARVEVE